jgi:malic enzyme
MLVAAARALAALVANNELLPDPLDPRVHAAVSAAVQVAAAH